VTLNVDPNVESNGTQLQPQKLVASFTIHVVHDEYCTNRDL